MVRTERQRVYETFYDEYKVFNKGDKAKPVFRSCMNVCVRHRKLIFLCIVTAFIGLCQYYVITHLPKNVNNGEIKNYSMQAITD